MVVVAVVAGADTARACLPDDPPPVVSSTTTTINMAETPIVMARRTWRDGPLRGEACAGIRTFCLLDGQHRRQAEMGIQPPANLAIPRATASHD